MKSSGVTTTGRKWPASALRFVLFDWGDTLMFENGGPDDITMADWPEVRALEGAAEMLQCLAARYTLAIATNATISKHADILRALGRVGLAGYFGEIFCYTELGLKKEDPMFWQTVLTRLRATPEETVMVGDTLEPDVRAPLRSGIRAIWFNWKNLAPLPELDVPVIHRLLELPAPA
jgi:HAD superfamily hydrolase (TIGR01509 family)